MLKIDCHVNDNLPVTFETEIDISPKDIAAIISTTTRNTGDKDLKLKYISPYIKNLQVQGCLEEPDRMLAMIPQETGGVVTLKDSEPIGMKEINLTSGLPKSMNIMQVANIYDRSMSMGINVLYLNDYWGGEFKGSPLYWAKGENT